MIEELKPVISAATCVRWCQIVKIAQPIQLRLTSTIVKCAIRIDKKNNGTNHNFTCKCKNISY